MTKDLCHFSTSVSQRITLQKCQITEKTFITNWETIQ